MTQSQQNITLDGYRLAYSTAGDPAAPPLLLLHGLMSHRGVWWQTIEAFQASHYCVAVDLLGFGDSDKPREADYSIPAQGKRVLQLADALGWSQFTLMGHSMGGQIALCIASTLSPLRIRRLISVAGVVSGRLSPYVENVILKWLALSRRVPQMFALVRGLSRYRWAVYSPFSGVKIWFYRMAAVPFEDWALDREMAFQPQGRLAAYQAGQAIRALNLTSQLGRITAPTLVIFGQQDAVVPVSDGRLVQQHVPNSRLVLIDDCGHYPMYEKPAQYLAAVRTFLLDSR